MAGQAPWVLVLEDNPVQYTLYERILIAGGYTVTCIQDPLGFLNNLDHLPPPALLLLDIVFPDMDGITILQRLEKDRHWCAVPVILMTASPTRDRVAAAQKLPVPPEGFLVKPIDPSVMLQLVQAVLARREAIHLLRSLQRTRLGLSLSLAEDLARLEGDFKGTCDDCGDMQRRLGDIRRELQSLRVVESAMDIPEETRGAIRERMRERECTLLAYRRRLDEADAARRQILRQRQQILNKQKSIRDLERQILALANVLKGSPEPAR